MNPQYLITLRHAKRIPKSEELSQLGIEKSIQQSNLVNSWLENQGIEVNPNNLSVTYSDKGRAKNTADYMGLLGVANSGLSYSPDNYQSIPWGEGFPEFAKAIREENFWTKHLASKMNNTFLEIAMQQEVDGHYAITHDSRIEAAIAGTHAKTQLPDFLGNAINNTEGIIFVKTQGSIIPYALVRNNKIIEIPKEAFRK